VFDLESLYKSLVRKVQEVITEINTAGISTNLQYYSWDSRGEEQELPDTDLLGLAGWAFRENGGLWEVRAGLTLSTMNDQHLFREIEMIDIIHANWGEGSQIPMVDKDTGQEFTVMVVVDFDMMPAGNSEKRNYRPIGIELLRTDNG
jgi:hypothetical protein